MSPRFLTPWILLAALLAAAGLATAAPPSETGWSPASYEAPGQDLALAGNASIMAFSTEDPGSDPGDQDLHFLDAVEGPVSSQQDEPLLDPEGTDHVVVSDDGTGLAAGLDVAGEGPNLHFFNRTDAEEGVSAWSEEFPQGVTALAITPDGDHLAVATADDTDGVVRLFETRGGDATLLFEHETDTIVHGLAVDEDGEWVFAGGETVVNGSSQGKVLLYSESAGEPVDEFTVEEDLPGTVRTVALTPDARYGLAGTAAGRVASFERSGEDLVGPDVTAFDGSQVASIVLHPDGGVAAAGATDGVHLLERTGSGPDLAVRWTHPTNGSVVSLDATRDLSLVVAAVPNPDGALLAYHPSRSEPVWEVPDGADHVQVGGDPGHVAVARGSNVSAYTLHRDVALGFPAPNGSLQDEPGVVTTVEEGVTGHVDVGLRNLGSVADTYEVSAHIPGAWNLSVTPDRIEVLPDETRVVDLAVTPGAVAAGSYNVSFTSASTSDATLQGNLSVPVEVTGRSELHLTAAGANASRPVEPGDTPTIRYTVENSGTARTPVEIFARLSPSTGSSADWTVSAPSEVGPLDPGEQTSFQASVQVPEDAPDGDARLLDVTVVGSDDRDNRSIRFVVNPIRDVDLDVQPGTRLVNATVPGFYNATVENRGTIDTSFKFIIERTASGTPGWTVVTGRDSFVVPAGEGRILPLRIVAPQNGVPGDAVSVNVQVVPEDLADQVDPAVQSNVTITAVFSDLPDRDEDRPIERIGKGLKNIPGPGAGAVLLALAAGGAAARSRGSGQGERGERRTPRTSETYKSMQATTGDHPSSGPPCCWSTSAR